MHFVSIFIAIYRIFVDMWGLTMIDKLLQLCLLMTLIIGLWQVHKTELFKYLQPKFVAVKNLAFFAASTDRDVFWPHRFWYAFYSIPPCESEQLTKEKTRVVLILPNGTGKLSCAHLSPCKNDNQGCQHKLFFLIFNQHSLDLQVL